MEKKFVRENLKRYAKNILAQKYWALLLVALLIMIIEGDLFSISYHQGSGAVLKVLNIEYSIRWSQKFLRIGLSAGAVMLLVRIFIGCPLLYGCMSYFKEACFDEEKTEQIICGFYAENYWRVIECGVRKTLTIILYSLLFLIPGIMKSYGYRFTNYILYDFPELSVTEALHLSEEMTDGIKWDIFVLDLSFILWDCLQIITFGISGIFVSPYKRMTDAELYIHVRESMGIY